MGKFGGKELISENKGFLRKYLQKFFLILLSKIAPNKYLSYKNQIRIIMNHGAFQIRFYLAVFFLRFKYPLLFKLPSRHLYAYNLATIILKIAKKFKIDLFLTEGCLLGAIRQNSFAGRPIDLDFGIKYSQFEKLEQCIPIFKKNGARVVRIRCGQGGKPEKLQILFSNMLIDIDIFFRKTVGKKEKWVQEFKKDLDQTENAYDDEFEGISFPIKDLESLEKTKVYGKEFLIPQNPEVYLEKVYGKSWKKPSKKQFMWTRVKQ